jgi:hypothetical protein
MEITIKRTLKLEQNIFENVIIGALEGGSNYWYCIGDLDRTNFIKGESPAMNIAIQLFNNPEYKLKIYDIESAEDPEEMDFLGDVTQASMIKAFELMANKYPEFLERILDEENDADDDDVFFQLATMGEVIYG